MATKKPTKKSESPAQLGRKRDPQRDNDLLEVTLEILAEVGYDGMTMELVASRAKAGKGTVYRRWDSKEQMVLDAVGLLKRKQIDINQLPDTGTLRGDLVALFKTESSAVTEKKLKILGGLASMLSKHPDLGDAANRAMAEPWVEVYTLLMNRARDRREISSSANIAVLAQVIPSMAAYRSLVLKKAFEKKYLLSLIDEVLLPALSIKK